MLTTVAQFLPPWFWDLFPPLPGPGWHFVPPVFPPWFL